MICIYRYVPASTHAGHFVRSADSIDKSTSLALPVSEAGMDKPPACLHSIIPSCESCDRDRIVPRMGINLPNVVRKPRAELLSVIAAPAEE